MKIGSYWLTHSFGQASGIAIHSDLVGRRRRAVRGISSSQGALIRGIAKALVLAGDRPRGEASRWEGMRPLLA